LEVYHNQEGFQPKLTGRHPNRKIGLQIKFQMISSRSSGFVIGEVLDGG